MGSNFLQRWNPFQSSVVNYNNPAKFSLVEFQLKPNNRLHHPCPLLERVREKFLIYNPTAVPKTTSRLIPLSSSHMKSKVISLDQNRPTNNSRVCNRYSFQFKNINICLYELELDQL